MEHALKITNLKMTILFMPHAQNVFRYHVTKLLKIFVSGTNGPISW